MYWIEKWRIMQTAKKNICKNKINHASIFEMVALFLIFFALYDMSRADIVHRLLILHIDSFIIIRLTIGKTKDKTVEKTKTDEADLNCLSAKFRSSLLIVSSNVEINFCCCKFFSLLIFELFLQI